MAVFEYKGFDAGGKAVSGIVDSDNAKGARAKLRRQGLFPTEVKEQRAGKVKSGKGLSTEIDFGRYFQRVSNADVSAMTSQLATLVGAGIPMVESLSALIDQTENQTLKLALVEIREDVNQGDGLAKAMRKHPRIFSDLYVNMVSAGESSGALDTVLNRLTDYTESQVKLRGKVLSAMMYPVLMAGVGFLIITGLFVFVIPRIRRVFDSFGATLPLLTRALIGTSDAFTSYWWAFLILGTGAAFTVRWWVRTPEGRRRWHSWQLNVPLFGRVNRLIAVSRFCRTLSTLLDSGVPILTAVGIVGTIVQNDILAEAIQAAGKNIREGQSIAGPLKESGQFPPLVTHMIAIGEKTGELEPMLGKVSDAYDQQVDNIVGGLTSLLEPLLILMMGGVVTLVALAFLLPMLSMSSIVR